MPRALLVLALLLVAVGVASAEPPSDATILTKVAAGRVCDAVIIKNRAADGVILPLPGLGFVPLPVQVWDCTVWYTPAKAPAGAPKKRDCVRLLTLAW
jgi:hypothetical protein